MPTSTGRGWDDVKEQVKSRLSLVEVVSQHVRLRRQGREFTGLCPFHEEKTPSFWVNEQMQSWYCFGCQRGGDLFTFQELIEKTDFRGALQSLAELAGVEMVEAGPGREQTALRRRILEMNKLAVQYFEYVLWSTEAGEAGRRLLERREVGDDVARRFGLGYAPGGSSFAAFVRRRGRPVADAVAAGLVRRDGSDFFQERVLIPIRDERGQPLAFTGRTVRSDEQRKYVNTAETPAYVKGRVLYALDIAREGIQKAGHAVLMEGQFDVIVGHRFGVSNAIAASGTALTEEQVRLLKRFTEEVVLVFDNDRAGRAAAFRAIEQAQAGGLRTRVGLLEGEHKDPDEFLRAAGEQAPERWDAVLRAARPGWEFWIRDSVADLNTRRPDQLEVALRRIDAVLAKIPDTAVREQYRELVPTLIDVNPSVLSRRFRPAAAAGNGQPATIGPSISRKAGQEISVPVAYLLSILSIHPGAAERVRTGLPPLDLDDGDRAAVLSVLDALEGGLGGLQEALPELPEEVQDVVRRAWAHPPGAIDDAEIDKTLLLIRRKAVERRRKAIISDLRDAEARGDGERMALLQARLRELIRETA